MPFFAATAAAAAATPTSPLDQAISLPRKVNHLIMVTLLRCAQLSDLLLLETSFHIFKITIRLMEELLGNANPPTSEASIHVALRGL